MLNDGCNSNFNFQKIILENVNTDFCTLPLGNSSPQSTVHVNTVGLTSGDIYLEQSVDGETWAPYSSVRVGVSDAGAPFLFSNNLGNPRHFRLCIANLVGSVRVEVWKS